MLKLSKEEAVRQLNEWARYAAKPNDLARLVSEISNDGIIVTDAKTVSDTFKDGVRVDDRQIAQLLQHNQEQLIEELAQTATNAVERLALAAIRADGSAVVRAADLRAALIAMMKTTLR